MQRRKSSCFETEMVAHCWCGETQQGITNKSRTRKETPMIYKRGKTGIYWYKFMWQGKLVRESSKQGNDKVARNIESAHRSFFFQAEDGIRDKKLAPTLNDFLTRRFEPWAKARFE